jgi:hypothetical protein
MDQGMQEQLFIRGKSICLAVVPSVQVAEEDNP